MFYNEKIFKRCFCYTKKYWYKNIMSIPLYFKLMHHLIKYGYDEYATWETFNWFIHTIKPILINYNKNRWGTPVVVDNFPLNSELEEDKKIIEANENKWNEIINRMIELLDKMDETTYKDRLDWEKIDKEMKTAKDEFFTLFSKYFYNLWD